MADRRPISLRISLTDRCQLRCVYCTPAADAPVRPSLPCLTINEIRRFVRIVQAEFGLAKVRLTGGEPLLRRGIVDLVALLARQGVSDLAMTTNGQHLAEVAADLKRAGLCRVNVSLDTLEEGTFRTITGGGDLRRTLQGLDAARRHGLCPVRVNMVVLRGYNDHEVVDLARFALERGYQARFLELMPLGCARRRFGDRFVPTSEIRGRLETAFRLTALAHTPGDTSRDYLALDRHGGQGIIGLISPHTRPFCAGCTRLRLTSTGQLMACLARGRGPNIRRLLQSASPGADEALRGSVARVLAEKQARVAFTSSHLMVSVGG